VENKDKIVYLHTQSVKTEASTDNSITVSGYASTSDVDRQGDIVQASAWKSGLTNYLKNPVILAYHDPGKPIGRMVEHKVDDHGLWIKARISTAAQDVFNLVKDGVLTAFSIGFRIAKGGAEYDENMDVFLIKELELHEISVVSIPANQNTLFSLSKSFADDTADEYKSFKLQFAPKSESAKGLESFPEAKSTPSKEWKMNQEDMNKLLAETAQKAAEEATRAVLAQQAKDVKEKALREAQEAELESKIKAAVAVSVQTGTTGAERLLADVEKRLADSAEQTTKAISGLQSELKEKADEIAALRASKMTFSDKDSSGVSYQDKEKAVMLAKMMGRQLNETKFGAELIAKSGAHIPTGLTIGGVSGTSIWETDVSLQMQEEIRRKLVIAPLFRSVPMRTNVQTIPVNPETGTASWVTNANFGAAPGTLGDPGASAGNKLTHALKEITLNSYKVATNEYLAYEEEEDSLLSIMPIVRDAMVRRVARAIDKALLLGAGSGSDPIRGLVTAATNTFQTTTAITSNNVAVATSTTAVTMANMRAMRKLVGVWALDPAEVVFVVNTKIYYDLLEDTSFQSVQQVGVDTATLLKGQIGFIGGSPVVVSGEFAADAASSYPAICFAPGNFLVGEQRGLRMDTQELVETQRRVLVASQRMGMVQLSGNLGNAVSVLKYTA
jgi:HK97 family phage prohead protease/HK97 family phage major capsid protein